MLGKLEKYFKNCACFCPVAVGSFLSCFWIPLFGVLFVFLQGDVMAQKTVVYGKVKDAATRQEVPFVNVMFKNTFVGMMADENGGFSLSCDEPVDSVMFSSIGYKPLTLAVKRGRKNRLSVSLTSDVVLLSTVEIRPGENPAFRVLRLIDQYRKVNNPVNYSNYACYSYNKVFISVGNLSNDFRKKRLFRNNQEIFLEQGDSAGHVILPVYIQEDIAHNLYQNDPAINRSNIVKKSKKGIGSLDDTEIEGYADQMKVRVNFYDNLIQLLGRSVISPLHPNGKLYYRYYLLDSVMTNLGTVYKLSYKPKNSHDVAFTGKFNVRKSDGALTHITADLSKNANINFVNSLSLAQDFDRVPGNDSSLFWKRNAIDATLKPVKDNALFTTQQVLQYHQVTEYEQVRINFKRLIPDRYDTLRFIPLDELSDFGETDTLYSVRYSMLDSTEQQSVNAINALNDFWLVKTGDALTNMFVTGYVKGRLVDVGPYTEIFKRNRIEGYRFNLSLRTSEELFKNLMVFGHVGCGLRDERWKGGLGLGYKFKGNRRKALIVRAQNDMDRVGDNRSIFLIKENMQYAGEDNVIASWFSRRQRDKLSMQRSISLAYEHEWNNSVSTTFSLLHRRVSAGEFVPFRQKGEPVASFLNNEMSLRMRLSWNEKRADLYFRRYHLGTKYPVINILAATGNYTVGKISGNYLRLRAVIKHHVNMGITRLNYVAEAGAIFSKVPFPMLEIHRANPTYGYSRYAFNQMQDMEYASDRFASVMAEYHLNGLLLNRIPIIRTFDCRAVTSAKLLWGELNKGHRDILALPEITRTLNKPYAEVGAGIENIFQVLRVEGVWRLTPSHIRMCRSSDFGLRLTCKFSF